MAEPLVRADQELLPLASHLLELEEYVEEPLFDRDDGQGPPSNSDEDEDLTSDEEDGI